MQFDFTRSDLNGLVISFSPLRLTDFISRLQRCSGNDLQFRVRGRRERSSELVFCLSQEAASARRCLLCLVSYAFHWGKKGFIMQFHCSAIIESLCKRRKHTRKNILKAEKNIDFILVTGRRFIVLNGPNFSFYSICSLQKTQYCVVFIFSCRDFVFQGTHSVLE